MDNKLNIYISAFFTGILILSHWLFGVIFFEVNDDLGIIALLKGLNGFTPGPEAVFVSPILGIILFGSYKVFPGTPWFSLLLYVGMSISCFVAGCTVLRVGQSTIAKFASLSGVGIFVALLTAEISFTATCLMLWISACALFFVAVTKNDLWGKVHWLASGQMAVVYLLRPGLLPILLVFASPLLVAVLVDGTRRIALKIFVPFLLVTLLGMGWSGLFRGLEYKHYEEFNRIRADFTDSARSSMTTRTLPALFSVGWSYDDYVVMKNWWFHDGAIFSKENIDAFISLNAPQKEQIFSFASLKMFFDGNKVLFLLLFLWCVLWSVTSFREKNFCLRLLVLFGLFLAIFFLMGVRFPRRVALPGFFMLFLYGQVLLGGTALKQRLARPFVDAVAILIVLGIFWVFLPVFREITTSYPERLATKQYLDNSVAEIVGKNGPDTLLADVNPHILPLNYFPFEENDPILQVPVLGTGWLVESPMYLDQLRRAGLGGRDTVVPAMIDKRRIVLRFWDSPWLSFNGYVKGAFLRHLRQHYDVPGSGRTVDVRVLKDFRQNGNGVVYFHLVTVPT